MSVNIHGKEYKTVAERVNEAHAAGDLLEVITEVLYMEPQIMVKATIKTKIGTFTGISAADPNKSIEAKTPVEVAETSAVGRALAFAGYAGSEIASAEELVKAIQPTQTGPSAISVQQVDRITRGIKNGEAVKAGLDPAELGRTVLNMTSQEAITVIKKLNGVV